MLSKHLEWGTCNFYFVQEGNIRAYIIITIHSHRVRQKSAPSHIPTLELRSSSRQGWITSWLPVSALGARQSHTIGPSLEVVSCELQNVTWAPGRASTSVGSGTTGVSGDTLFGSLEVVSDHLSSCVDALR